MSNGGHPTPRYSVQVDGTDITALIAGRLVSLTLTDNRGFEADQLDIVLNDADCKLRLPPRGALVRLAIGWEGSRLVDKGSYTVDEVDHAGAPDQLTIRARSADLRGGLSTQVERSFHAKTVNDIVCTIAGECDLEPLVAPNLAGKLVDHLDQTNESSANLLTRLAGQFDAMATVKSGKLLFAPIGAAASASGKALPPVLITRDKGDSHRFNIADRETYTAVRANYYDTGKAEKGEVIWGKPEDDAELGRKAAVPVQPATPAAQYLAVGKTQKSRAKAQRLAAKEWKQRAKQTAFRSQYAGVKVAYDDGVLKVQGEVAYGKADEQKAKLSAARQAERDAEKIDGTTHKNAFDHSADNIKTLRHVYASQENAKRAARAEWRRLQRGMATFTITLAYARPELFPEVPATVKGWKPEIDSTDWLLSRVTHSLSDSGFTTALELEIRATEIPG